MSDERVEQLLRQGAHAEAAAELRRLGHALRAQELYERIWDFRSAAEVARERGDRPALLRLLIEARDSAELHLLHAQLLRAPPAELEAAAQVYEQRRLYGHAGELREALGDLLRARDHYRSGRRLLDAARLSERLGELREAGLLYEELLRGEGEAPAAQARAHLGLGRVLRAFGRHEEAVRHLQRARRAAGADAALREELADPLIEAGWALADSLRVLGYGAVARRLEESLPAPTAAGLGGPAGPGAAPAAPPSGLLLGRYRLLRLLGAGGMGRVHLAEDALQQREVAIKIVPPPRDTTEGSYARFLREARAAGALRHPHIVPVLEAHEAEGVLVLEHVSGGTLADRALPLPTPLARRLLLQLLDALAAAHACGLIHRDIKPQNIFLTVTADAKLGDFGAAHLLDLQATQTAGLVGTLAYMAPEQITGGPLSFATDVYSLGVTAFQMATGRLPFPGPDFVGQHLGEPPPRPSSQRPGLHGAWDALCLRALAKAPEDRFGSLDEMRAAVRALPAEEDRAPAPAVPAPGAATARPRPNDIIRIDAPIGDTGHSTLLHGTDTRLGRALLIEEFPPGLLQGEAGAAQLRWLRAVARAGGPGLQRVLRIDLGLGPDEGPGDGPARVVYEAPIGAPVRTARRGERALLRQALRRLHAEGAAHGAVASSLLREESSVTLLVFGRGPLGWSGAPPTAADDLAALDALGSAGQEDRSGD